MTEDFQIDWSVRPITRYQVTRHEQRQNFEAGTSSGSSTQHGEFTNAEVAYEVAYALAEADRVRHDLSLGDDRVQFPKDDPRYTPASPAQDGINRYNTGFHGPVEG